MLRCLLKAVFLVTASLSAATAISGWPLLAQILHCSQPWSEQQDVCPEACRRWPQYCYYAVAAKNGVPGTCELPPYPRIGSYRFVDIELNGGALADFSLLYSCPTGYILQGQQPRCVNGNWTVRAFPSCKTAKQCVLQADPSVAYNCIDDTSIRRCPDLVDSGQQVIPACRPGFVQDQLRAMHCGDGSWDYVATCRRECGTTSPSYQLLSLNSNEGISEAPWHAIIYKKTTTPYMQICGGSLVSATVAISAAHCFWDDVHKQLPAEKYAIAVGKTYRPWNFQKDNGQKSDISDIKIPPYFRGQANSFQSDISLVTLKTPVMFNLHVRPVCLDFNVMFDEQQLQPGNIGKVAAWNLTPVLKIIEVPCVAVERCFSDLPQGFLSFITADKFCAGTWNGTSLCRGDSGGGLVLPRTEHGVQRWYLRGVVSTAPMNPDDDPSICRPNSYTAFTHLVKHDTFVTKLLKARRDDVNQIYLVP